MGLSDFFENLMVGMHSYWEAVVLSIVIVIISLIIQIPYGDDDANDPGNGSEMKWNEVKWWDELGWFGVCL